MDLENNPILESIRGALSTIIDDPVILERVVLVSYAEMLHEALQPRFAVFSGAEWINAKGKKDLAGETVVSFRKGGSCFAGQAEGKSVPIYGKPGVPLGYVAVNMVTISRA